MLKICFVFWKSEPQYAYKRYAYEKTCIFINTLNNCVRFFNRLVIYFSVFLFSNANNQTKIVHKTKPPTDISRILNYLKDELLLLFKAFRFPKKNKMYKMKFINQLKNIELVGFELVSGAFLIQGCPNLYNLT